MSLRFMIAIRQAEGLLLLSRPSIEMLRTSEQNLVAALNDPDLTQGERAALLAALASIRETLQRLWAEETFDKEVVPKA